MLTIHKFFKFNIKLKIGKKIMKLLFQPQNQIKFQKIQNNIMEGQIQISNPHQDIFAFKIKCTNPELFGVDPLKGIVYPKKSIQVQFKTNDPVNLDMAKQIALNQKFLIQYVAIPSENTVPNFRHLQCQKKKLYINMDSAHGSRLVKDNERMSMNSAISNKYSYLSMKNDGKDSRNLGSSSMSMDLKNMSIEQQQERYQKLKNQINDLNNQRSQVIFKLSENTKKGPGGGLMIKLIIFLFFLAMGVMAGKRLADIYNQNEEQLRRKQQQEQGESWFSFDFLFQEEQ